MSLRNAKLAAAMIFFVCCILRVVFRGDSPKVGGEGSWGDPLVYDFGTMPTGQTFTHVFALTNDSDHEIQITEVRAGCTCTTTELPRKIIKPHDTVPLTVTVSLENLRGNVEQHVVVKSSHPTRPIMVVKTRGIAESAYRLAPTSIDFGKVSSEQELEGGLTIASTRPESFSLLTVTSNSSLCQVSHETIEERREYRVMVRTIGKLPLGFWKAAIVIETDNRNEPRIVVPVVARVRAKAD